MNDGDLVDLEPRFPARREHRRPKLSGRHDGEALDGMLPPAPEAHFRKNVSEE
jgi:hypothetical protein